ncbi:MAG: hydroxymethylglutaryl-CoA reductase, partial [Halobacteriales archaeon]
MGSDISGFYKLSMDERREKVKEFADLTDEEVAAMAEPALDERRADTLSENVVGTLEYPLSIATNFVIDGEDRLIPMAVEETSVVAAASYAASLARPTGGFTTSVSGPRMIAQIQAVDVEDPQAARLRILEAQEELKAKADEQ